jgi:hypothetical protein
VACQFDISYWNNDHCGSQRIACLNIPAFDCCDTPPSRASFHTIKATSSGQAGVVVFTYTDNGGGYNNYQFTGAINKCFDNTDPFNTAYLVDVATVCASKSLFAPDTPVMDKKQSITASFINGTTAAITPPSQCRRVAKLNRVTCNGQDYDISGPEYEAIVADFMAGLNDAESLGHEDAFSIKWAHLKRVNTLASTADATSG